MTSRYALVRSAILRTVKGIRPITTSWPARAYPGEAGGQTDGRQQREDANNFTLLRLLLAVLVIFGHFKLLCGASTQFFPYNLADAAVDAFFVVSGFLITGSFERSRGIGSFYIRRIFRLVPMYVFVVLLQTVFMLSLLPAGPFSAIGETLRYLFFNLIFANFAQHDVSGILQARLLEPTLNPSLWTLKIEMGFYLIAPAVYAAMRRWGGGVLVAIFVASAFFQAMALHLGFDQYARQLPGQLQFFVVGIALYYYGRNTRANGAISAAVSVGFIIVWTWFWPIPSGIRPLVVGAFVFCFVLGLPVVPLRFDLSYSVYLLHGPVIQILLLLGFFRNRPSVLIAIVLAVLALSFVTEHFVERPGIEFGKRLARRIERLPRSQTIAFSAAIGQPGGNGEG